MCASCWVSPPRQLIKRRPSQRAETDAVLIAERCCEAAPRDIPASKPKSAPFTAARTSGRHWMRHEAVSVPTAEGVIIGREMGVTVPSELTKRWTADHTRRLLAMKREGLSTTTIALRLGCSRTTVRKKLQEIERQTKQDNR